MGTLQLNIRVRQGMLNNLKVERDALNEHVFKHRMLESTSYAGRDEEVIDMMKFKSRVTREHYCQNKIGND